MQTHVSNLPPRAEQLHQRIYPITRFLLPASSVMNAYLPNFEAGMGHSICSSGLSTSGVAMYWIPTVPHVPYRYGEEDSRDIIEEAGTWRRKRNVDLTS